MRKKTLLLLTGTFKKKINTVSIYWVPTVCHLPSLALWKEWRKHRSCPYLIDYFGDKWSKPKPKVTSANTQFSGSLNLTVEGPCWLVFQWCHQVPASFFHLLALPFNMFILLLRKDVVIARWQPLIEHIPWDISCYLICYHWVIYPFLGNEVLWLMYSGSTQTM